jgi:hypothetical protein
VQRQGIGAWMPAEFNDSRDIADSSYRENVNDINSLGIHAPTPIIAAKGRMAWQKDTGYGRRNHVETAIGRYKQLIGPKQRARSLPGQQGEVAIAVAALNRMIQTAKPMSVRSA